MVPFMRFHGDYHDRHQPSYLNMNVYEMRCETLLYIRITRCVVYSERTDYLG